jgi:hypothetical protein
LIATEAEFYWKEKKRRSVKISKIKRRAFEPLQVFEGAVLTSAVLFKQSQWYDYPPKFILAPSGKLRHDRYRRDQKDERQLIAELSAELRRIADTRTELAESRYLRDSSRRGG